MQPFCANIDITIAFDTLNLMKVLKNDTYFFQALWKGCNVDGDRKVTKKEFIKYMGVSIPIRKSSNFFGYIFRAIIPLGILWVVERTVWPTSLIHFLSFFHNE